MKYHNKLILRIFLAFILSIFYKLFYFIFKPPTLYFSFIILKMFDNSAILIGNLMITKTHSLIFVDACAAASAYLLLSLLILLTKGISLIRRAALFVYGSLLILIFNVVRILILFYCLFNYSYDLFVTIHLIVWKFLSTIFVFFVWIYLIKRFNINNIPIYSDIKHLWHIIYKKK